MRVILARCRVTGGQAPPSVHAFRVPDRPASVPVWHAVCGVQLAPTEAEVVPQYTGAPCSVCLMATIGDQAARSTQQQRTRIGTRPAMQPVSRGRYAPALHGEHLTHLVGPHAARSTLDGEAVVQGLCGHLGWGPLVSPPPGYPVCVECREVERTGS